MDIHHEVDNILASLSQPSQLRFEFHPGGCTMILCNALGEHKYEMTLYQLLILEQTFTFGDNKLSRMMDNRTIAYFTEYREQ